MKQGNTSKKACSVAKVAAEKPTTVYRIEGCDYRDYQLVDFAVIKKIIQPIESKRKGPRGGVAVPFPVKLYEMLVQVEKEGMEHIVSWQPHGRAFLVHRPQDFVKNILPRFFKQSKITSFQRQLNLYGFQRLTTGVDRNAYYHELFLRGRPEICPIMLRTRVKNGTVGTCGSSPTDENKSSGSQNVGEVTLYAIPRCPPANSSTHTLVYTRSSSSGQNNSGQAVMSVSTPAIVMSQSTITPTTTTITTAPASPTNEGYVSSDEVKSSPPDTSVPMEDDVDKVLEFLVGGEDVPTYFDFPMSSDFTHYNRIESSPTPILSSSLSSNSLTLLSHESTDAITCSVSLDGSARSTLSNNSSDENDRIVAFEGQHFTIMEDDQLQAYESLLLRTA